ncbi:hypothetical protein F1B92_07180, partial [Campylobacter sp. FMV-PI01]|nr:hypothetical protein [Campylobacter portucalensis]
MKNGKAEIIYAGISNNGNAYSNNLTIEDGNVTDFITGGYSNNADAYNNKVIVKNGHIQEVYGGRIGNQGTAYNNKVEIVDGNITKVLGATINDYLSGNEAVLKNNEVVIKGGKFHATSIGYIAGAENTKTKSAFGNKVTILGGDIKVGIYGSRVSSDNMGVYATENTVTIGNLKSNNSEIKIDKEVSVYGGYCWDDSKRNNKSCTDTDVTTGNTLQINDVNLTIKNIHNFENVNFALFNLAKNDTTLLKLTDTNATDLNKTKIGIEVSKEGVLKVGDTITLIQNDNGITPPTNLENTKNQSPTNHYLFKLETQKDGNITKIVARVYEIKSPIKQKNAAETNIAAVGVINSSS